MAEIPVIAPSIPAPVRKSKAGAVVVVIFSILLIGGGLFLWFRNKKKVQTAPNQDKVAKDDVSTHVVQNTSGNTITLPNTPFKNAADGNAFRGWLNDTHADYAKANQIDRVGAFDNAFIRKGYKDYGVEYEKYKVTKAGADANSQAAKDQAKAVNDWIGTFFYARTDVPAYVMPEINPLFFVRTFTLKEFASKAIGLFMGLDVSGKWGKVQVVLPDNSGNYAATILFVPMSSISPTA